jgi:hypothetical protein
VGGAWFGHSPSRSNNLARYRACFARTLCIHLGICQRHHGLLFWGRLRTSIANEIADKWEACGGGGRDRGIWDNHTPKHRRNQQYERGEPTYHKSCAGRSANLDLWPYCCWVWGLARSVRLEVRAVATRMKWFGIQSISVQSRFVVAKSRR